jgi:hypothetical protein
MMTTKCKYKPVKFPERMNGRRVVDTLYDEETGISAIKTTDDNVYVYSAMPDYVPGWIGLSTYYTWEISRYRGVSEEYLDGLFSDGSVIQ